MTAKAQIVQHLAKPSLPELLAAAIEANDRAKVRMTLLQEAVQGPSGAAETWIYQSAVCNKLKETLLASLSKRAQKGPNPYK